MPATANPPPSQGVRLESDASAGVEKKSAADQLFEEVDWTSRDSMMKLFPTYVQELHELRKRNVKNVNKAVFLENFTLKTPYGDQTLLANTELKLEQGKRQCLYGANSTGKTLLFHNIASNEVRGFPRHINVHHCRELEPHEVWDTVLNTVVNSHPYRRILVRCEERLRKALASDDAAAADARPALQDNLDFVVQQMESIRGYDAEERAAKMLRVLGFDDIGQQKPVSALSGGLRMRVALCMAFFIDADLLLLDEPTNHLDFPSVLWLENRLRGYSGSFLLVSHDRELLNNVCTAVLMLEDKQIKYYHMGFKEFEVYKAKENEKKAAEIEKFLQRHLNPDPSTALGRERHDKKLWSDNYYRKQIAMQGKFTFPEAVALSSQEKDADGNPVRPEDITLIDLANLRFSYDPSTGHYIFNDPIDFRVTATTRVGVMGPNGAGKSTLLKLLTHKLKPTEGSVQHHPNFTLCYFGQHSTAELNLEMTASEFMHSQFPSETMGALRAHLAKTGIVGGVADTRMKALSYSQRSCIIFAKLTFICPHLLILDEPTNFLDLESVDSLIGACNKYKGALLLVSHNRDFLRKCARKYLSVVPGHFKLYDTLKTAENATYSFISDMESGGKVGKEVLMKNPGGGTVHASQKVGAAAAAADSKEDAAKNVQQNGGSVIVTMQIDRPDPRANMRRPGAGEDDESNDAAKREAAKKEAAAKKAAAGPVTYVAGEQVQAKARDGKYYAATLMRIVGQDMQINFPIQGQTILIPSASVRKIDDASVFSARGDLAGSGGSSAKGGAKGGNAKGGNKGGNGGAKGGNSGAKAGDGNKKPAAGNGQQQPKKGGAKH